MFGDRNSTVSFFLSSFITVNFSFSAFYIVSTMSILSLLEDVKKSIAEQMKSLPEDGTAETMDFEVWGRAFCELMVRTFECRFTTHRLIFRFEDEYKGMAVAINDVRKDDTLDEWIREAQAAFAQFANEEWLDWGAGILMPQVATAVAQRKADEAKAKLAADIVSARTQLRADFKAKRITVDELQKKLEELGRIEAKMVESTEVFEDNDDKSMGDPSDVMDTGKVAVDSDGEEADEAKGLVVPQGRGAKRKSDDDGNGFRDVEGQVRGV